MTVLLLHAYLDGYAHALTRLRQLERGAQVLYPSVRFVRALGRTPDEDPLTLTPPDPGRVDALVRRLLLDATEVWLCCPRVPELAEQLAAVGQVGLVVDQLSEDRVALFLAQAEAAEAAQWSESTRRGGWRGPTHVERQPSAESVVLAWLRGAEAVMGARTSLPNPDAAGGCDRKAMVEEMGSRLAFVGGVMAEAQAARRWPRRLVEGGGSVDVGTLVLRAMLLEGRACAEAATLAGLGNAMAASRSQSRALDCVREVLASRRERARSQDQGGQR